MKEKSRDAVRTAILVLIYVEIVSSALNNDDRLKLRDKVVEMFDHAYNSYMNHAYPADELMPLSCKGRVRGITPSRGDIDDALGNFSLTLIDTLDTLALMGKAKEFESAIKMVLENVQVDSDIVVSVFETNIRVLGGLLGAHVTALDLKKRRLCCLWYEGGLLEKAKDIGYRLLPAFNTSTGIPYPRVNLKHGVHDPKVKDTCTACAGSMVLEFAALSRLTGIEVFEDKAHRAMDYLWQQRNRHSDLMGTVINIHNGDWVRRESGIGAGIDSYYEYLLKAYILLGEETYLQRFNKHYDGIMRYISQGPLMMNVEMHRPTTGSRNFMDALLAFWPGLQVLKGDLNAAIELHELLYQVTQRHNFLPEAFTTDFHVHWAQHPLRPEFVESTYFLYKATGDPYYLDVGKSIIENLEKHARVPCGFAAIRDVRQNSHEDQMDSYVLAETFKYLYLLYTDPHDLVLDIDDYVFTTEAHLLPLSLSMQNYSFNFSKVLVHPSRMTNVRESSSDTYCPNFNRSPLFPDAFSYANKIRLRLKDFVEKKCPKPKLRVPRLKAADFISGSTAQQELLAEMGIKLVTMKDGRVQLIHSQSQAADAERAEEGLLFMREMLELAQQQHVTGGSDVKTEPRVVQLMSEPFGGLVVYQAGAAQFGHDLAKQAAVEAPAVVANPFNGCSEASNPVAGRIVVVERGGCMFIEKARHVEAAGGLGVIVIDNNVGTTSATSPFFHMSGDGVTDVSIPIVFLFRVEGSAILEALQAHERVIVRLANKPLVNIKAATAGEQPSLSSSTRQPIMKTHMAHMDNAIVVNIELSSVVVAIGAPYRPSQGDEQDLDEDVMLQQDDKQNKKVLSISIAKLVESSANPQGELPDIDVLFPRIQEVLYSRSPLESLAKHGDYMRALKTLLDVAWGVKSRKDFTSSYEELLLELFEKLGAAFAALDAAATSDGSSTSEQPRSAAVTEAVMEDDARSGSGACATCELPDAAHRSDDASTQARSFENSDGIGGCEHLPDNRCPPAMDKHHVTAVVTSIAVTTLTDDHIDEDEMRPTVNNTVDVNNDRTAVFTDGTAHEGTIPLRPVPEPNEDSLFEPARGDAEGHDLFPGSGTNFPIFPESHGNRVDQSDEASSISPSSSHEDLQSATAHLSTATENLADASASSQVPSGSISSLPEQATDAGVSEEAHFLAESVHLPDCIGSSATGSSCIRGMHEDARPTDDEEAVLRRHAQPVDHSATSVECSLKVAADSRHPDKGDSQMTSMPSAGQDVWTEVSSEPAAPPNVQGSSPTSGETAGVDALSASRRDEL